MQTTMRPQRVKIKPKDEAAHFVSVSRDKDGFDVNYINSFTGRGVFSKKHFDKGAFLLEYRGDLINKEHERLIRIYHDAMKVFLFELCHNGRHLCVDAAREDDSLGRLVNYDHLNSNSRMKTVTINGNPHLCLFGIKDIKPGEEITYNYGNSEWPWRVKVAAPTDQPDAEEHMASIPSSLDPQVAAPTDQPDAEEHMASIPSSLDPQETGVLDPYLRNLQTPQLSYQKMKQKRTILGEAKDGRLSPAELEAFSEAHRHWEVGILHLNTTVSKSRIFFIRKSVSPKHKRFC